VHVSVARQPLAALGVVIIIVNSSDG
jgi:hypothetical protein